MPTKLRAKRVYDDPADSDGQRILVDRLWPRGLSKAEASVDYWAKSLAPSTELRQWYQHDAAKWEEFKRRFFVELDKNPESVNELMAHIQDATVTFLFSSRESSLNNANALIAYLTDRRANELV